MKKRVMLKIKEQVRTALQDGTLIYDSPKHMATQHLYKASKGSILTLQSDDYVFAVALFSLERDLKYSTTYDYPPESNWTTYQKNLTPDSYQSCSFEFEQSCYFRICLKRVDGMDVSEVDAKIAEQQVVFETEEVKKEISSFYQEEIERTISEIQKARGIEYSTFDKRDKLTFGLVADTHYMVNGTWEDTALHINAVHKGVSFDEIIHLGDVTDGCTCAEVTKDYVNLVLDDLHSLEIPVRVVIGNHDSNYLCASLSASLACE